MTARAPSCPSCGAPATGQERACGFCHAPIATVRCAACFHMNSPDFLHCAGCGRVLGLEPIPESTTLPCPRCNAPLAAFGSASGRLSDCSRCGGQLVEHGLLRELVERTEICGGLISRKTSAHAVAADTVRYLPCPMCRSLMNRTNFGVQSGVIVDVCANHGIWFDAGELPKVLDFVESGGLHRARRRQLEELARERRDARVARVQGEADPYGGPASESSFRSGLGGVGTDRIDPSLVHSAPPAWTTGLWEDARDAAHEMLAGLTKLIKKG